MGIRDKAYFAGFAVAERMRTANELVDRLPIDGRCVIRQRHQIVN